MAIIGNKLYRQVQDKQDASYEIDHQLSRMEDDIRKLKIEFDIFFNGASKRPPLEAIEESLRRKLSVRYPGVRFSFEAGDIVSQVLNFGALSPVGPTPR